MLDKAIAAGKERRKPWRGSKAIDSTCRCHGGCAWCLGNRVHKYAKAQAKADYREEECEK